MKMKININESSRLRKVRCTKIIYSYVGFLTVKWVYLLFLCLLLRLFSSYWFTLSSLHMKLLPYLTISGFVFFVCLLLEDFFFLKRKRKGVDLMKGRSDDSWKKQRKRKLMLGFIIWKIIYFQKKIRVKISYKQQCYFLNS